MFSFLFLQAASVQNSPSKPAMPPPTPQTPPASADDDPKMASESVGGSPALDSDNATGASEKRGIETFLAAVDPGLLVEKTDPTPRDDGAGETAQNEVKGIRLVCIMIVMYCSIVLVALVS